LSYVPKKIDVLEKLLRYKIINDINNNILFKYSFGYIDDIDFKNIKQNMDNYDIPYKKNNNKVIELLSITKKIFNNQCYYTNDIYDELQETPNDWSDSFITNNKIKNIIDMNDIYNINDDDIKDKLKLLYDYLINNNYKFHEYNNIFYTATPQDSLKSLLILVKFYLDIIKDDYDQSPSECIILKLIVFHYECIIKYINIIRVLMADAKLWFINDVNNLLGIFLHYMDIIQYSFLENPSRSYLTNNNNICSIKHLLIQLESDDDESDDDDDDDEPPEPTRHMDERHCERLFNARRNNDLFDHILRQKKMNKFFYRGLLIMEYMGDFYRIIYKEYKRIDINERNNIINKIVDILQREKLNMYFSRQ
jgi:hypothetical protein